MASKLDNIWCGTFNEVTKYLREKQNALIIEKEYTASRISFGLEHTMDNAIFNFPLTLKTEVPADWANVNVTQNGINKSVVSKLENGKLYVYYDAIPNETDVVLTKLQ